MLSWPLLGSGVDGVPDRQLSAEGGSAGSHASSSLHALPPWTVQLFRSCTTKRQLCCWAQRSCCVTLGSSRTGYSRGPCLRAAKALGAALPHAAQLLHSQLPARARLWSLPSRWASNCQLLWWQQHAVICLHGTPPPVPNAAAMPDRLVTHRQQPAGACLQLREQYMKNEPLRTRQETYTAIDKIMKSLNDPFTRFLEPAR